MKHSLIAVVSVLAIALAVVLPFGLVTTTTPAQASQHTCTVTALGSSPNLTIRCTAPDGSPVSPSDIDVDRIVDGVVTVVVENEVVRTVVKTITKTTPGPTRTVTVRPEPVRVTETVRVPREQATVFVAGEPRKIFIEGPTRTQTVTARPDPTRATPTEPVGTRTTPPSPRTTGQLPRDDDTLEDDDGRGFFSPDIDLGDDEVTAGEVGIGLLTLLGLLALLLVTLYAGYILGYKDKERKDTDFIRVLLEASKMRRNK